MKKNGLRICFAICSLVLISVCVGMYMNGAKEVAMASSMIAAPLSIYCMLLAFCKDEVLDLE